MRGAIFAAALAVASPALAQEVAEVGKWRVETRVSAIDGVRTVAASAVSAETLPTIIGTREPAVLVIRCAGGQLAYYVAWPGFLGGRAIEVTWKADAQSARSEVWNVSSDGAATGFFHVYDARKPIEALARTGQLVVRAAGRGVPQEATFDVTGADRAAPMVLEACPAR